LKPYISWNHFNGLRIGCQYHHLLFLKKKKTGEFSIILERFLSLFETSFIISPWILYYNITAAFEEEKAKVSIDNKNKGVRK
jgi:hypothetical protein